MDKKPDEKPMGPPAPPKPAGDAPPDEQPHPGRPPHWHEGDPEPVGEDEEEDEEKKHLPPKHDTD